MYFTCSSYSLKLLLVIIIQWSWQWIIATSHARKEWILQSSLMWVGFQCYKTRLCPPDMNNILLTWEIRWSDHHWWRESKSGNRATKEHWQGNIFGDESTAEWKLCTVSVQLNARLRTCNVCLENSWQTGLKLLQETEDDWMIMLYLVCRIVSKLLKFYRGEYESGVYCPLYMTRQTLRIHEYNCQSAFGQWILRIDF